MGSYYCNLVLNEKERSVLLHQGRFVSKKRLLRRISIVSENKFELIKSQFAELYKIKSSPFGEDSRAPFGEDIYSIPSEKMLSNRNKNGKLSLVATPIGNLEDITLRAIRTLKECELIACENTSDAQRLLKHYEITTPTTVFFSNSKLSHIDRIMKTLEQGGHVALISDAGTPCISDPGVLILNKVRAELPDCVIESIPGASALTVAVSLSGIVGNRFNFLGFVPNKKGRETLFKSVAADENASVMYESVHRIEKLLESFSECMPERELVICRELTKMYEQVVRGKAREVSEYFKNNQDKVRGEFVVIVI